MAIFSSRRCFFAETASVLGAVAIRGRVRAGEEPARGMVTGQLEAARAGNGVLAAGGNAVDAIVAAALVAGVAAVPLTGIAGYGGHCMIASPDRPPVGIDFNTTAPAAASPDMFHADDQGRVKDGVNNRGWLAVGVPGVLAGLQLALDKFGTRSFTDLVKPAIRLARDGFPITKSLAASIKSAAGRFKKDVGSARLFLKSGEPLAEGDMLRNPDLATLLEKLAGLGRVDDFYRGKTAEAIAAAFKKNGGLITANDLAAYRALEVTPLSLDWQGFTIYTPPPTAGGLTVLQGLASLKALGWEKWDAKDPAATQARIESLRVAWTDRLKFLGDPKHAAVPIARLLSARYAEETAGKVRAAVKNRKPVEGSSDGRSAGGTIHLSAMDRNGLAVAWTFTHGESFGAQVAVDGLGLVLGHGISRFDPRPGRANSIAAGKRPLHNMCPTVVTRQGQPVLALGAIGGRRIPNTVFDVLAYRLGQNLPIADAVQAPRVHTEGDPAVRLEAAWPPAVVDHLKRVGYTVKTGPGATLNAIERDPSSRVLTAAAR
jgi:gamma-glutamyltranspeptidase / glutathione hydrolase